MKELSAETICEIRELMANTYPKITINKADFECPVLGTPANGVVIADHVITSMDDIVKGEKNILVIERAPSAVLGRLEDVRGIVTVSEDPSSHLSIVCKSNGVPVLLVHEDDLERLKSAGKNTRIALDGFSQKISVGDVDADESNVIACKKKLLEKISSVFGVEIAANADTATEIAASVERGFRQFWPRTETMLYEGNTLSYFNALLLEPANKKIAHEFQERHRDSIQRLFFAANGGRIGFRLLDPPSHEFLPDPEDKREVAALAEILETTPEDISKRIRKAREQNPMIGHRGARLLLTHDTILDCQIKNSLDAWVEMEENQRPESLDILVPFIMHPKELIAVKERVAAAVRENQRYKDIPIKTGAMIEIPSILFYADEIAQHADFISYGTNDLVALTHGISRGDSYDRYLTNYIGREFFEEDPFVVLPDGVAQEIATFSKKVKERNPAVTADMCGEHAVTTDVLPLLECGALDSVSIGMENLSLFAQNLISRCPSYSRPSMDQQRYLATQKAAPK